MEMAMEMAIWSHWEPFGADFHAMCMNSPFGRGLKGLFGAVSERPFDWICLRCEAGFWCLDRGV